MLNKAPKLCQTRNYSEIYSCVCSNVLLNKMKLNIEDSVTKITEFKFKMKKCLLMTPATFEWKKINASICTYIYTVIGIYKWENVMEMGKRGKPVWRNFLKWKNIIPERNVMMTVSIKFRVKSKLIWRGTIKEIQVKWQFRLQVV